ncbi:uncharacterized protein (Fragment) domain protein [Halorubrum sp. AJ67]
MNAAATETVPLFEYLEFCSIENAVRERDHSVLTSFLRLLSANERMISRNYRYQNCERRGESCVRLIVE